MPDVDSPTRLPDVRALADLRIDEDTKQILGFDFTATTQQDFDTWGLWWAVPFAYSAGYHYAFRLSPGAGHGAVLRCSDGHAVTIASRPEQAIFAMLAVERLLIGANTRARLHDNMSAVRGLLRDAIAITGGDPAALDDGLHVAEELPKWVDPAPVADEERRRQMLWRITNDEFARSGPDDDPIWSRARDARAAPDDIAASLRLLQGNHGLDGTHFGGGLSPGSKHARELLVACAQRVRDAGVAPEPAWAGVVDGIANRDHPEATDFIKPSLGVGPLRAWDTLAAASYWFYAVDRRVPEEHAEVAETIAKAAGAQHVLAARRIRETN